MIQAATRNMKTNNFMKNGSMACLPKLHGIYSLTKQEIKKDMREMLRDITIDDDDTDSSIKSDDILESTYPVKPRKTPRRDRLHQQQQQQQQQQHHIHSSIPSHITSNNTYISTFDNSSEYATITTSSVYADIDEKLKYISMIENTEHTLAYIESQREEKEVQYRALVDSLAKNDKEFSIDKKMHENYYHVMQALQIRVLQLRTAYITRNLVLLDSFITTQRRKQAAELLKSTIVQQGETKVLNITLIPSNKVISLYIGQYLSTPMGEAMVKTIYHTLNKLELILDYGIMYVTLASVLQWFHTSTTSTPIVPIDMLSDDYLLFKWKLQSTNYNMPANYNSRVKNLLSILETPRDGDTDDDDTIDEPLMGTPATSTESATALIPDLITDTTTINTTIVQNDEEIAAAAAKLTYMLNRPIEDLSDDLFAYLFAPPATLPFIVENEFRGKKRLVYARNLDPASLSLLHEVKEVEEMQEALYVAEANLSAAEATQQALIFEVEKIRQQCSKLVQKTTDLRLAMFTRRVCFRNMLAYTHPVASYPGSGPMPFAPSDSSSQDTQRVSRLAFEKPPSSRPPPADVLNEDKPKKRSRGKGSKDEESVDETVPSMDPLGEVEGGDKKKKRIKK